MIRKRTPEERERALDDYQRRPDLTVPEIAARHGVSESTLYAWAALADIPRRERWATMRDVRAMAEHYRRHRSIELAAAAIGFSPETVARRIRRYGVEIDPPGRTLRTQHAAWTVLHRTRDGRTAAEIAEETGLSETTVLDWRRRLGLRVPRGGRRRRA